MQSTTEYGSPTYSVIQQKKRLCKAPPAFYPVHKYPTWGFYSAYPPPDEPTSPFRECNKLLDFSQTSVTPSAIEIPRCHRLHYIPRVFTGEWTALERLTALRRLQRFLSQNPISAIPGSPHAVGLYIYFAKTEKIDLGLLPWPQQYWNHYYEKNLYNHKVVEKAMGLELERLISVAKISVKVEAHQEQLKQQQRVLQRIARRKDLKKRYSSVTNVNPSSPPSIAKSRETGKAAHFRLATSKLGDFSSRQLPNTKGLFQSRFKLLMDRRNISALSISSFSNLIPASYSEQLKLKHELDEEDMREWVEVNNMNRGTEGLGWWTEAMMRGEQEEKVDDRNDQKQYSNNLQASEVLETETGFQRQQTKLDYFEPPSTFGLTGGLSLAVNLNPAGDLGLLDLDDEEVYMATEDSLNTEFTGPPVPKQTQAKGYRMSRTQSYIFF